MPRPRNVRRKRKSAVTRRSQPAETPSAEPLGKQQPERPILPDREHAKAWEKKKAEQREEEAPTLEQKLEALEDRVLEMDQHQLLGLVTLLAEGLLQVQSVMARKGVVVPGGLLGEERAWEDLFEEELCEYAEAIEKLEEILE